MGWNNPALPWSQMERALRPARSWSTRSPSTATAATRRPGPASGALPGAADRARADHRALRRAALPHQLQLPRRGQPPRGAGRGGGPAGADRARRHRPRRVLRRGAVRRGGPRAAACPPSSAPSCRSDLPGPQNGEPDPVGRHLLVLARGPRGTPGWPARSPRRSWPAGRRAARTTATWSEVAADAARPRAGADRLPQGARAGGAAHRGRRGRRARASWTG